MIVRKLNTIFLDAHLSNSFPHSFVDSLPEDTLAVFDSSPETSASGDEKCSLALHFLSRGAVVSPSVLYAAEGGCEGGGWRVVQHETKAWKSMRRADSRKEESRICVPFLLY